MLFIGVGEAARLIIRAKWIVLASQTKHVYSNNNAVSSRDIPAGKIHRLDMLDFD